MRIGTRNNFNTRNIINYSNYEKNQNNIVVGFKKNESIRNKNSGHIVYSSHGQLFLLTNCVNGRCDREAKSTATTKEGFTFLSVAGPFFFVGLFVSRFDQSSTTGKIRIALLVPFIRLYPTLISCDIHLFTKDFFAFSKGITIPDLNWLVKVRQIG